MIPAITDFRAKGTIIGLAGLTAVFGMGTGVTPPVWSPEMYPAGGQARPGTGFPMVGRTSTHIPSRRMSGSCSTTYCQTSLTAWHADRWIGCTLFAFSLSPFNFSDFGGGKLDGSAPIGVVK